MAALPEVATLAIDGVRAEPGTDAVSTPELNIGCAEGEHHALIAKLAATARVGR